MSRTVRPCIAGRPGRNLRRFTGEKEWRQWQVEKRYGSRQAVKAALRKAAR